MTTDNAIVEQEKLIEQIIADLQNEKTSFTNYNPLRNDEELIPANTAYNKFIYIKGELGKKENLREFFKKNEIDHVYSFDRLGWLVNNNQDHAVRQFCEKTQTIFIPEPFVHETFDQLKQEVYAENLDYFYDQAKEKYAIDFESNDKNPIDTANHFLEENRPKLEKDQKGKKLVASIELYRDFLLTDKNKKFMEQACGLTNNKSLNTIEIGTIGSSLHKLNFIGKINEKVVAYNDNKNAIKLSGISTGYYKLDDLLDGLQKKQLITLAARTGVGKTWVALNFAYQISVKQKLRVYYVSLEMSITQLTYRLLSLMTGINAKQIKRGQLDENQLSALIDNYGIISQSPLYIADDYNNSDLDILIKTLRAIPQDKAPDLVIVDHIGLIHSDQYKTNRVLEVGAITRQLVLIAKELDTPIIAISQLSRAPEKRLDQKPVLTDLRDSGSVEQDSDVVLFIHRDDYYDKEKNPGKIEFIVSKNRDGEVGSIYFERQDGFIANSKYWLLNELEDQEGSRKSYSTIEKSNAQKSLHKDFKESAAEKERINEEGLKKLIGSSINGAKQANKINK